MIRPEITLISSSPSVVMLTTLFPDDISRLFPSLANRKKNL